MSIKGPAALLRHGGRMADARAAFPHAPAPWLDLSTGVNPFAWKGPALRAVDATRLPDPVDTAALEATAAACFGAPPSHVVAVPGSEAALRLLPRLIDAKRIGVISPTYASHAEAWRAAGCDVELIVGTSNVAPDSHDALVVVNPNNPDGRAVTAAGLRAIAAQSHRWLIVDEAFSDATPELSVAPDATGRLVVLRSFGKFYGLPGLRLGFVICDLALAEKLRAALGDWPVSAAAIAAGRAAYADSAWQIRTRRRLAATAKKLDGLLKRNGFAITGGTTLFRLTSHPDAAKYFTILAEAGVLVRAFAGEPTWLRFGLPPASGWARLTEALERCR